MRFATERESLILALACILLTNSIRSSWTGLLQVSPRIMALCLLVLVLLIGQTRSIFLLLPMAFTLSFIVTSSIRPVRIIRGAVAVVLLTAILWGAFKTVMPSSLTRSVQASVDVVFESVNPEILGMLISGDITSDTRDLGLSPSGNTTFRLVAWAQVIESINEVNGGWWIGAPLGSGFTLHDGSGIPYENLDPHNDYISIVAKVGLIGLAGYLLILAMFIAAFRKASMKTVGQYKTPMLNDLLTILFLLALFVGLNAEIRIYGTHFWIWALLGFGFKAVHDVESSSPVKGVLGASAVGSARR